MFECDQCHLLGDRLIRKAIRFVMWPDGTIRKVCIKHLHSVNSKGGYKELTEEEILILKIMNQ
jgi:hypothetical protein